MRMPVFLKEYGRQFTAHADVSFFLQRRSYAYAEGLWSPACIHPVEQSLICFFLDRNPEDGRSEIFIFLSAHLGTRARTHTQAYPECTKWIKM